MGCVSMSVLYLCVLCVYACIVCALCLCERVCVSMHVHIRTARERERK